MGMYTTCAGEMTLKEDTPDEVLEVLEFLAYPDRDEHDLSTFEDQFDHPFFECRRWSSVGLVMATPSLFITRSYWDGPFDPQEEFEHIEETELDGREFQIIGSIKNYDSEYSKLLEWLKPHLEKGRVAVKYTEAWEPDTWTLKDGEWDIHEGRYDAPRHQTMSGKFLD